MNSQSNNVPHEYANTIKQRLDYFERVKEKMDEERTEEEALLDRAQRLMELKNTDGWKMDMEPKLVEMLITLESQFCSSDDKNKCFALVRAYDELKRFKLWIDESAEIRRS
jgi:hypothetical protein